ncbi:hypothetical protein [Rathayibacter tritici]|uniref:Uncharacterized protein n=1 Tax=Rathayibacter tritici TaxID=33888 RepID=A0A160KPJ1_9MICO|nr:hypothetical protein [Rathayibacter tritici]AND15356.1 hypothetical protein A6122_0192 [Rathayibacter tritici]PPI47961.1 hypothetical protein C5D18_02560 [Rathayibacter tritici]
MTTTTTGSRPALLVDPRQDDPTLRAAEVAVDTAAATGDADTTAAAARALIVTATAYGWPTATALVFTYETTGPTAHAWGLWKVLGADRQVLREWEAEPGGMSDESEEELIALDLISNRRATLDYTDFPKPLGSTTLILHTLAL